MPGFQGKTVLGFQGDTVLGFQGSTAQGLQGDTVPRIPDLLLITSLLSRGFGPTTRCT